MSRDLRESPGLADRLHRHAASGPERPAYVFLANGEDAGQCLTYAELVSQSEAFAGWIRRQVPAGGRALLMYPTGPEFVCAFLGCLYAGVLPVPATIPRHKKDAARLAAILKDARAATICTTRKIHERTLGATEEFEELRGIGWMIHEDLHAAEAGSVSTMLGPETIAFLQYTSGSTSTPKGVVVSHANLVSTLTDLNRAMGMGAETVMVGWAPLFHDLGLVVTLLATLYAGGALYSMAPMAFIEQPIRWLKALSRYRGTHTAAPNFAYDLCLRKVPEGEKDGLDLSSLKYAMNAAEPVRLETLREFSAAFSRYGFDYNAFAPGYGLAEATVMVSTKAIGRPPGYCTLDRDALEANRLQFLPPDASGGYTSLGCGWSCIDADIRIVDPNTRIQSPPDRPGEIWVKSASVAMGYWERPEETQATFHAVLADSGAGPFLRTGDMGFVHGGELYIAGRIKDLLIIQGRNHYPQDIELTVEDSHPALRPGCGVAFSVDDGRSEHLVVVQEVRREHRKSPALPEVINTIRMAVAREHGIRASAVILIMPATVPKTTSGKIRRGACREAFLKGLLSVLADWRIPDFYLPVRADPDGERAKRND